MSNAAVEIRRINYLDKLFSAGGKYTPEELADKLTDYSDDMGGTSVKTVYRILNLMKEEFNAPIAIDDEKRRYYSTGQSVILPSYVLRAEKFHNIDIVKNLLESVKESPIYNEAKTLISELSELSPKDYAQYSNFHCNNSTDNEKNDQKINVDSRIMFLNAPAVNLKNEIWNTIYDAMKKNYHIRLEYKAPGHEESTVQGVRPYQLIFDDGIWDLWGYNCVNKRKQLYNLCRIKKAELVAEPFDLPSDYDFHNQTPGNFGCFRDLNSTSLTKYKIHFKKDSYAESYASDRSWGVNQDITVDNTGTTITFENNQFLPILRWVLGWGADAHPMEPKELVDQWSAEISKMADSVLSRQ